MQMDAISAQARRSHATPGLLDVGPAVIPVGQASVAVLSMTGHSKNYHPSHRPSASRIVLEVLNTSNGHHVVMVPRSFQLLYKLLQGTLDHMPAS